MFSSEIPHEDERTTNDILYMESKHSQIQVHVKGTVKYAMYL